MYRNSPRTIATTATTPPTIPPAIAPVLVLGEDDGVEDAVTVVVAAPEDVVAEDIVETEELLLGVVHISML